MEIKLEDLDQVRERTGVSYAEAKMALEEADGNVVDAIVALEEKNAKTTEKNSEVAKEIVEKIKEGRKNHLVHSSQCRNRWWDCGSFICTMGNYSSNVGSLWL